MRLADDAYAAGQARRSPHHWATVQSLSPQRVAELELVVTEFDSHAVGTARHLMTESIVAG